MLLHDPILKSLNHTEARSLNAPATANIRPFIRPSTHLIEDKH